ncbi:protein ERGIC-53-like [Tupaia chinensis]|uniref:protein ERGIC-53-like n=1 Tax=Tupaia chinensis TaxID=246437 RepID=UPI000FFBBA19|nr:protein ERGIC-53-like [Tupaia chinensis]
MGRPGTPAPRHPPPCLYHLSSEAKQELPGGVPDTAGSRDYGQLCSCSFRSLQLSRRGPGPELPASSDAIPGLEQVRLAPSMRNRSGAVWSRASVPFSSWEVEMRMRVTGPGRRGAQGMVRAPRDESGGGVPVSWDPSAEAGALQAVWYTWARGRASSALEGAASWGGIGVKKPAEGSQVRLDSPAIRVLAGDGRAPQEQPGDGASRVLGSCHRDFRNRPYPVRARITYWGQRLRVSLNSGLTPSDPEELCVDTGPLLLAPGGFFGVLAATSTLADDHDVLSFLTFSLSQPGPEAPPQPFLETEQFRLARQLEKLRARLALGTSEDVTPMPNSKAQEEGKRLVDLEEMLGRHNQILQALRGLSEQLAQAERQWKQQLGSSGWPKPEGGWDSAKVSTLLRGQHTLLHALRDMRDAAARMASGAQVFHLPVGTEHHFSELAQILTLLQKDLRDPVKRAPKAPRPSGRFLGTPWCLQPGFFLFFLLIQSVGFFCYVHFRQELDKSLRDLPANSPAPRVLRALGAVRRQLLTPGMRA